MAVINTVQQNFSNDVSDINRCLNLTNTDGSYNVEGFNSNFPIQGWLRIPSDLNNGLLAYYPFNGNANDESGNSHHGTKYGGINLTSDRFGNSDSAFYFDGVNDYIDTNFDFSRKTTESFSFSLWFKTDNPDLPQVMIGKAPDFEYSLCIYSGIPQFNYWVNWGNNSDGLSLGSNSWLPSSWNHMVVTYDGVSRSGKLYSNHTLVSQDNIVNYDFYDLPSDTFIGFGYLVHYDYYYFKGVLDDIRIYNRQLSQDEVWELYNQPIAKAGPNQIICYEICSIAVLDGRKSYDPNGKIVSYKWDLKHKNNSAFDISANGVTPNIVDPEIGIYDVTLTVTDNEGLTASDKMELTVLDTCNSCTIMKGDLDGDGTVDAVDLSIFLNYFGTIPLTP